MSIYYYECRNIENDVRPFLELKDDLLTFTQENLLLLLSRFKIRSVKNDPAQQ